MSGGRDRNCEPGHRVNGVGFQLAGDVKHSGAWIEKAKKYLNYEPIVSFEESLKRTVEFYMEYGFEKKSLSTALTYSCRWFRLLRLACITHQGMSLSMKWYFETTGVHPQKRGWREQICYCTIPIFRNVSNSSVILPGFDICTPFCTFVSLPP